MNALGRLPSRSNCFVLLLWCVYFRLSSEYCKNSPGDSFIDTYRTIEHIFLVIIAHIGISGVEGGKMMVP